MELFSIPCSTCGARLKVKSLAAIGQIFNCPKCQSMVLVEPPPGWTPPAEEPKPTLKPSPPRAASKPSPAAVSALPATPTPDAAEFPVATLEEPPATDAAEPLDAAWQSPEEARWRRSAVIGAGAALFLGMVYFAWSLGRNSSPDEVLVKDEPPAGAIAEPPAEPVAEVSPEPPAVVAVPDVAEKAARPAKTVLRHWLPAEPHVMLSLPMARLADHEAAPEILASGSSPLRETLAELRQSFHLTPDHIRRLTWVATRESNDLRHAVVTIELAQPLADDAALLAGCERLDLRLGDAFCHRPAAGGWAHPFAIIDPQTIITGPRELLETVAPPNEASEPSRLVAALNACGQDECLLSLDIERFASWDALQWPRPIAEWSGLGKDWSLIKEAELATLKLQLGEKPQASLRLDFASTEVAQHVHRVLTPAADKWIEGSRLSVDDAVVIWRGEWLGDARQLAADLVAALPAWTAPPPAVAARPAEPVRVAIEQAPPAVPATAAPAAATRNETPFERQVARRFEERIPAIVLRGMKLGEFAGFVSRMTGVTIALDEAALVEAGIDSQAVIAVELSAATIGEIVTAALSARELELLAEENRLLITTRAKARAAKSK